jgi:hypothetical protein
LRDIENGAFSITMGNALDYAGLESAVAQAIIDLQAYTRERVKQVATRRKADELLLAKARDDVIEKRLVEKQAAYLLVALRQKILTIPQAYSRRILGLTDVNQASRLLKEMALSVLNEIKDLPQKVVDPRWLEDLDKEEAE